MAEEHRLSGINKLCHRGRCFVHQFPISVSKADDKHIISATVYIILRILRSRIVCLIMIVIVIIVLLVGRNGGDGQVIIATIFNDFKELTEGSLL